MKHFDTLMQMMAAFPDEQSAIDHLTAIRWKSGAYCPHCGSAKVYHFSDNRTHKCGDCRKRFSIKVGTIFEDSKVELRKWFMAIWLITSHKKGVASTQLAKDIGVTQKTAWFMLHRLRHAARTQSFSKPLEGEVEVDETFYGPTFPRGHRGGDPAEGKTIVLGMLERGGSVVAGVVPDRTRDTIFPIMKEHIDPKAEVHTDNYRTYRTVSDMGFVHKAVNHHAGEYVSKDGATTNAIEGFWGLLKRQIVGIHHFVTPKHLNRYVSENAWRFNLRDVGEGERVNILLDQVSGRLTYKELTA